MIRDDIIMGLEQTMRLSQPKQIRLGVRAMSALIARAERSDLEMSYDVARPHRFMGVPFKQFSPLTMDPDSWEIVPGHCEFCDGRGYTIKPLTRDIGPETAVIPAGCDLSTYNPFRGPVCPECNGEPLPSLTGSIQ